MARPKSEFIKAFGKAFEVFQAIINMVLDLGGSDEEVGRLITDKDRVRQIAELIIGKAATPIIQVAWSLVLPWIIAACKFASYVNGDITAANFPYQPGDLTISDVVIVKIERTMSTPDVLKLLDDKGLRPARLMELLWWWLTHPAEQSNCLVVALGSVWHGFVPYVIGGGGSRELNLDTVGYDWDTRCAFAAVSK